MDFTQSYESSSESSAPQETSEVSFSIIVSELTKTDKDFSLKISTKTTSSQFKSSNFFCLRTYTDFTWLNEEISLKHLDCIIPSLPPKPSLKTEGQEKIFVQGLQRFLNRIGSHPVLQKNNSFQLFLEGDQISIPKKKTQTQVVGEAIKTLSTDMLKKGQEQDSYFEEKRGFVNIYDIHTKSCLKTVEKKNKLGTGFATQTKELSARFQTTGEVIPEEKLSIGTRKIAKAMNSYSDVLSEQTETDYNILSELFSQVQRDLHTAKVSLDNRLQISVDYDNAIKNTRRKKETLEKLKNASQSKPDKISKAQNEVAEADKQESDSKDLFTNISENLKTEFTRVEKERVVDFKLALTEYVQNQIHFETKILELFDSLIPEIHAIVN